MLRRLSRTQNTVFCGRILLFLAKFFPFSERSGLNIISEFNLDNTTVFSINKEEAKEGSKMEVDGANQDQIKIEEDGWDLNIDYALYSKFWQLQDFFRNPLQCYEPLNWHAFSRHARDVFGIFKSFKLDALSGKKKYQKNSSSSKVAVASVSQSGGAIVNGSMSTACSTEENQVQATQDYFAKYLTNQNLLQLQLSDSNFRRYILVQFLILFQYLQSTVKFKSESQVLAEEQNKWISDATEQVYSLIDETPPNGAEFAKAVKHILKREEQWNRWKNDGCPPLGTKEKEATGNNTTEEGSKTGNGTVPQKGKAKLGYG